MKATLSDFGLSGLYVRYFVAKNPVLHSRTKHIDVRFHFSRDHYEKGDIDLVHVASKTKLADIFTKPLEFGAFVRFRGFEVRFKKGACCVLDAEETLVFRVDLTVSGPAHCLVASPSADIWKWHRRLGHLSFDLLVK
ncbi:hypothetical protein U9M48_008909 [Paspalum notatum var. saurae]|uniref:GAG-pre-integrase domain-containing protein n=1 Tax=Paspalum notatum var. saurae TaxID=547442 RepID=A0AAQ3SQB4_PASNO